MRELAEVLERHRADVMSAGEQVGNTASRDWGIYNPEAYRISYHGQDKKDCGVGIVLLKSTHKEL